MLIGCGSQAHNGRSVQTPAYVLTDSHSYIHAMEASSIFCMQDRRILSEHTGRYPVAVQITAAEDLACRHLCGRGELAQLGHRNLWPKAALEPVNDSVPLLNSTSSSSSSFPRLLRCTYPLWTLQPGSVFPYASGLTILPIFLSADSRTLNTLVPSFLLPIVPLHQDAFLSSNKW